MVPISRILLIMCVSILPFFIGCAGHEIYNDNNLPENELAFVQGYWRYRFIYDEELQIISVDSDRTGDREVWPYAYSISLAPGNHWLQLAILRNGREIVTCAFEYTFDARHHYKLENLDHSQTLLAHPVTSTFDASVSLADITPDNQITHFSVPAMCSQDSICRKDLDCSQNYSCKFDAGRDFGTCKSNER